MRIGRALRRARVGAAELGPKYRRDRRRVLGLVLLLGLLRFSKYDHPQLGKAKKLTYMVLPHLEQADCLTDVGCVRRSVNSA
jgi:hypothetical protein